MQGSDVDLFPLLSLIQGFSLISMTGGFNELERCSFNSIEKTTVKSYFLVVLDDALNCVVVETETISQSMHFTTLTSNPNAIILTIRHLFIFYFQCFAVLTLQQVLKFMLEIILMNKYEFLFIPSLLNREISTNIVCGIFDLEKSRFYGKV